MSASRSTARRSSERPCAATLPAAALARGRARCHADPRRAAGASGAHRRWRRPRCSAGPPRGAALLTLALLVGILVSLVVGACAGDREVRPRLPRAARDWDPVQNEFGGLVPIYGTLVTSLIALLIAVPVSFGIALFLTELSPALAEAPARHRDRAARRGARRSSTACGACSCSAPILADYVQPPLQTLFGERAVARRAVLRARRSASACCPPASSWRS